MTEQRLSQILHEAGLASFAQSAEVLERERDEARAQSSRLRAALEEWELVAIEEGDLRLLMSSLSGRALDKQDIEFSMKWGAALDAARRALAETPAESLEAVRAAAKRAALSKVREHITQTFGGMGPGSTVWGNTQWDKGYSAGVLAALTAFDTGVEREGGEA